MNAFFHAFNQWVVTSPNEAYAVTSGVLLFTVCGLIIGLDKLFGGNS